ncbi:protein YgfX [Kangiella sp. M94]
MNLFIDIQASKALPRVFVALWVLLILSFALFVISQYALLTSFLLLLVATLVFAPCALWQQKKVNYLNERVQQLQFVDGCWYLIMSHSSGTDKHSIELASDNVVWPWWIRLNYKLEQDDVEQPFMNRFTPQKKQLLICRDAVSETDFRHLSRVLRYYRTDHDEAVDQNQS